MHAAVELTDAADFLDLFRRTFAYRKLARAAERDLRPPPDAMLQAIFARLLDFARAASSDGSEPSVALRALELDTVPVGEGLTVRAARCAVCTPVARRLPRPVHKIDRLLHPASIGVIGVSATSMNFGRIILRNLMGSGYPKERLTVIRAGETEIDGVRCVESLKALPQKLDLLIVAVAADAVYGLVDEIIETGAVEAVMLIPGSLGETRKSREPAAALAARINAAHGNEAAARSSSAPTASAWSRIPAPTTPGSFRWSGCRSRRRSRSAIRSC